MIIAFVIVAYDAFNLSPDHVIKIHAIGRLGIILSFPQNLVHMCFFILVDNIKNWYYKVRQLFQNER